MDSIELWARNGEAVRQAIEVGEIVHLETASEEFTDAFLLFAIESGLSQKWAEAFPDPREEPEIGMEVILPVAGGHIGHLADLVGPCRPDDAGGSVPHPGA